MKQHCVICLIKESTLEADIPLCRECSDFFTWFDFEFSKHPRDYKERIQISYYPSLFIDYITYPGKYK